MKGRAKTLLSITFWSESMGRATSLPGFFAVRMVSMDANAEERLMLPLADESFHKHQKAARDRDLTAGQQKF